MKRLNLQGSRCFFMGSSEKVLALIQEKVAKVHPNIRIETYSPPYKPAFCEEENRAIVDAINRAQPDLLWIGMTAPKQERKRKNIPILPLRSISSFSTGLQYWLPKEIINGKI